ncbi:MAG: M23 family metallopeptidase [Hyphomonas sp.]
MVTRQPDGAFAPARLNARIRLSQKFVSGAVTTSLPETIRLHGGSADVSDLFARPVPTARSTGVALPGDRYELVYMAREDEHGHDLGMEDLLFAGFTGPGRTEGWYRFTPADTGVTDFYRADGLSYSQLLARYPIGRVRINSGFGKRTHPVSGEQLLHKGIDFGVPEGSEVLAAGDGVIGAMAWGDGYGKYVRIHHPDGYETVYAHLKGYKSGLKPGQTVRRGDMIGFVGDTGTATGAHLHYEIRRNGRVFDPMKLEFPANRNLQDTPEIMQAFREQMARIDMTRGRYEPAQAASAPAPGIRAKSP